MNAKLTKFIINNIASSGIVTGKIRIKIYNLLGMRIHNKAFGSKCYFSGNKLTIGKGSWVNFRCSFENHIASVNIGENCAIAMGVLFCTSSHELGYRNKRAGKETHLPIKVEDGCWIGANSTILQGVTIKKGCIITAGAVVTKDCEPNGLYAGVPAIWKKDLSQ